MIWHNLLSNKKMHNDKVDPKIGGGIYI